MDLLVLADSDGVIDMTQEAVSARTRIPLEKVNEFLAKLQEPDRRSRTPDADGRRLRLIDEHRDWGWLIVNYDRFRDIATEEQRRVSTKLRVRKHREKIRGSNTSEVCNASVTPCNVSVTGLSPSVVPVASEGRGAGGTISPTDKILRDKELTRVEAEIKRIWEFYGNNGGWSDKDKAEVKKLKGRREELKGILGMVV